MDSDTMAKRVAEVETLTTKYARTEDEVKPWLASVEEVIHHVQVQDLENIKYSRLPSSKAVTAYLNTQHLSQEQVVMFEELCRNAPYHIRPYVDKTQPNFKKDNIFYHGRAAHTNLEIHHMFSELYKDTKNIWAWLVERTYVLWDNREFVLEFIFNTLFKVCGMRAVHNMVLWERVCVSDSWTHAFYGHKPQLAVARVFFSAVCGFPVNYTQANDKDNDCDMVDVYIASVVVHNTAPENVMDVDFARCPLRKSTFQRKDDKLPVLREEIDFKEVVKGIARQFEHIQKAEAAKKQLISKEVEASVR